MSIKVNVFSNPSNDYQITIAQANGQKKSYDFATRKEAETFKRAKIKALSLTNQRGFYGNVKTGVELYTNY